MNKKERQEAMDRLVAIYDNKTIDETWGRLDDIVYNRGVEDAALVAERMSPRLVEETGLGKSLAAKIRALKK
jgi:hypothetical protein